MKHGENFILSHEPDAQRRSMEMFREFTSSGASEIQQVGADQSPGDAFHISASDIRSSKTKGVNAEGVNLRLTNPATGKLVLIEMKIPGKGRKDWLTDPAVWRFYENLQREPNEDLRPAERSEMVETPSKADQGEEEDGPQPSKAQIHCEIPLPGANQQAKYDNMTVTREEIDAKLAASEARTEARFAEMNGKFDLMLSKMDALSQSLTQSLATVQEAQGELKKEMGTVRQDAKEEARHTRHTLWAVAAIIVAIIGVAVTVWLGGLDLGTKVSDLVDQKVASIQPPAEVPPTPPQQ